MEYVSTRGGTAPVGFDAALLNGLAADGGLFMPTQWPALSDRELAWAARAPYAQVSTRVLTPFLAPDVEERDVKRVTADAYGRFRHPATVPLKQLGPDLWLMELFHGPTLAFKDVAMQLMAPLADAALERSGGRLRLVTATSGDTGAAAVNAFAGAQRVELVVLHPKGRVSDVQRKQMTTATAPNVLNLAVEGDFDDAQDVVKRLLRDPDFAPGRTVSSVNSINWARLAGQIPYFVAAAARLGASNRPVRFVVPTGNLGDAFAGVAARAMGAPIGPVVAAVNANDALPKALSTGAYVKRAAHATQSVSMDVAAPSNFERLLFHAVSGDAAVTKSVFKDFAATGQASLPPDVRLHLIAHLRAVSIDEAATTQAIAQADRAYGEVVCPHTAVGLAAADRLEPAPGATVVLATAHAAKFPGAVEAAIGRAPVVPDALAAIMEGEERFATVSSDYAAIKGAIEGAFGAQAA